MEYSDNVPEMESLNNTSEINKTLKEDIQTNVEQIESNVEEMKSSLENIKLEEMDRLHDKSIDEKKDLPKDSSCDICCLTSYFSM